MPALLCIELLGDDTRWRRGAIDAVLAGHDDFADLVLDTVASIDVAPAMRGDQVGNWSALRCPSPESALALGRRIFRRAWLESRSPSDERLWLRGIVLPTGDEVLTARVEPDDELPQVQRHWRFPGTLAALASLRAGVAGMRLLVADEMITDQLRGMFRIPLGRLGVIPFRRMNHTPYPEQLDRPCQDFLWMAETLIDWNHYVQRMKQRLLWSAHDPEEFRIAAATQVVFHECDAILMSVTRKNIHRREQEQPGNGGEHVA
jgi:hypothetical protein